MWMDAYRRHVAIAGFGLTAWRLHAKRGATEPEERAEMPSQFIRAALVAVLVAGPAAAQDTGAPAEADSIGQGTGDGLDLGESVPETRPQTYIKATHGDWEVQCIAVSQTDELCQMFQLLTDGAGNNVAEVNVFRLAGSGPAVAGGTFIVPLETLLTEKLTIAVDGTGPKRYDFAFCNEVGCIARLGFTQEDVDRFRAGAVAQVSIVPALAPDQRVTVEMSLSGFTAAFDEVTVARQ
jgi:invasion protein IalB